MMRPVNAFFPMPTTKDKIRAGQAVFGGWTLTGHAAIVEIMAGEGFDFVCVDMEHTAAPRSDFYHAALATPGIDAALIGPYDLSASMGLAGQLDHPDVLAAQASILEACLESGTGSACRASGSGGSAPSARSRISLSSMRPRHALHSRREPPHARRARCMIGDMMPIMLEPARFLTLS
jgi:hypothetical protein